jgi:hypothetical protein
MTGVRAVCNGREALDCVVAPQNASPMGGRALIEYAGLEFKHSDGDRPRGGPPGDARLISPTGSAKRFHA